MDCFKLAIPLVLVLLQCTHNIFCDEEIVVPGPPPSQFLPLPPNFIDPFVDLDTVPVHKQKVLVLLLGNLKGAGNPEDCDGHSALKALQTAASDKLKNPGKVQRLVRAVTEKLNASCDEITKLASAISDSPEHHADRLRRAAEDSAVQAGQQQQPRPPFAPPFFGFPGGPPTGPPPNGLPFRFGGAGQNPFFTAPMTSPALEMDLDRLIFIATPTLGINRAFELARALHLLHSPRSEVFSLQEQFQKNMTEPEATQLFQQYEQKLSDSNAATTPTDILHNTAQLSGLNSTEAHRFARAITNTIGPLNSTQAMQIHQAIQNGALNKSEIVGITEEIEKLHQGETVTPDNAKGHDWIFSGNKRSLIGDVGGSTRMFSSSKACGFAIQTRFGTVFPWMVTISCGNELCTGSLVSSNTVVCAADCVEMCNNQPMKVILGDARVVQPLEIYASSAAVHPRYSPGSQDATFNMALVTLSSHVDFNEHPMINPICLLYSETNDPDIQCEVVMCNGPGVAPTEQPVSKSPVLCYQPDNQICSSNGLFRKTACVSLQTCIPIQTQHSSPVICNRRSRPLRYYLWAVTIPEHSPSKCFNGVARISDSAPFIQGEVSI